MTPTQSALLLTLLGTAVDKAYAAFNHQLNKEVSEEEMNDLILNEQKRHDLLMAEYEAF